MTHSSITLEPDCLRCRQCGEIIHYLLPEAFHLRPLGDGWMGLDASAVGDGTRIRSTMLCPSCRVAAADLEDQVRMIYQYRTLEAVRRQFHAPRGVTVQAFTLVGSSSKLGRFDLVLYGIHVRGISWPVRFPAMRIPQRDGPPLELIIPLTHVHREGINAVIDRRWDQETGSETLELEPPADPSVKASDLRKLQDTAIRVFYELSRANSGPKAPTAPFTVPDFAELAPQTYCDLALQYRSLSESGELGGRVKPSLQDVYDAIRPFCSFGTFRNRKRAYVANGGTWPPICSLADPDCDDEFFDDF